MKLLINITGEITPSEILLYVSGKGQGINAANLVLEADFGKRAQIGDISTRDVNAAQIVSAVATALPAVMDTDRRQFRGTDYALNVSITRNVIGENEQIDGPLFTIVLPYSGKIIGEPSVRIRTIKPWPSGCSGPDTSKPGTQTGPVHILTGAVKGEQRVFKIS